MKKETIEHLLNAYAFVIDMMNDDSAYEGYTEELIYLRNTLREVLLEATCNG